MRVPFLAVRTRSPEETQALGQRVGRLLMPGEVLLLTGELGTGKTTFVKGVARGLDVKEPARSPSFTMMHSYEGRFPVLHVDLYRCNSPGEVLDLGLEQLIEAPRVSMIEWGEKAAGAVTEDHLEIEFVWDDVAEDVRVIHFRPFGRWRDRMRELGDAIREWSGGGSDDEKAAGTGGS